MPSQKKNWSITLGNKNAGKVITMVTDPYCIPCSKAHNMLHDWLKERDDLQLQIVFTASNEEDDIQTPVSRHIMALHQQNNPQLLQDAMHDWYNLTRKDYQSWAKRYPVEMSNLIYEQIDQQKEWCKIAEVTATPTILINGYRLPKIYQLKEIKYMLN